MRLLGLVRTVVTWLVGSYLLAAALGGPLLWAWISPWDNRGQAMALTVGPVCALLGTVYAARVLVAASGAEPVAPTPALLEGFRTHGVRCPQVWVSSRLQPGEAVAVRGVRRRYAILPSRDGQGVDDATLSGVDSAVRQLRSGTAAVIPLFTALSGWTRAWTDLVRFGVQGFTSARMDLLLRLRVMGLLPIALLAAPMAVLAYTATLLLLPFVGSLSPRLVARLLGTEDGRPRAVVRHRFRDIPFWARTGGLTFDTADTELVPTEAAAGAAPGRPVGILGLPRATAAGLAGLSHLVRLPVALLVVMTAYWSATIPAERLIWQGEHAVTGTATSVQRWPGSPAELKVVAPGGAALPENPKDFPLHEGQPVRLAASTQDGAVHYRLRDDTRPARSLVTLAFFVPLLLVPSWFLDGQGTARLVRRADEVSGRRRRRHPALARLKAWAADRYPMVGGIVVLASFAAWLGSGAGAVVGRIVGGADTARVIGGVCGAALVVGGFVVMVGRSALARRRAAQLSDVDTNAPVLQPRRWVPEDGTTTAGGDGPAEVPDPVGAWPVVAPPVAAPPVDQPAEHLDPLRD